MLTQVLSDEPKKNSFLRCKGNACLLLISPQMNRITCEPRGDDLVFSRFHHEARLFFFHSRRELLISQDFHHCCHGMCFPSLRRQHHEKVRMVTSRENFAPQTCSSWPRLLLFAPVLDRRLRNRTDETPPKTVLRGHRVPLLTATSVGRGVGSGRCSLHSHRWLQETHMEHRTPVPLEARTTRENGLAAAAGWPQVQKVVMNVCGPRRCVNVVSPCEEGTRHQTTIPKTVGHPPEHWIGFAINRTRTFQSTSTDLSFSLRQSVVPQDQDSTLVQGTNPRTGFLANTPQSRPDDRCSRRIQTTLLSYKTSVLTNMCKNSLHDKLNET